MRPTRSCEDAERTVALLDRSRSWLLRRLRSFWGGGAFVGKFGSQPLSTVLDGSELVLKGRRRAVPVESRHELVRFGAQSRALGVHDSENTRHGLETEGLRLGLFLRRHVSLWRYRLCDCELAGCEVLVFATIAACLHWRGKVVTVTVKRYIHG